MFTIKSVFGFLFKGVKENTVFTRIQEIFKPHLPDTEQAQLLSKYHDVKSIIDKGKQISNLTLNDKITNDYGTVSPWDWKNKYTLRAKVSGFDRLTNRYIDRYVTVSSDEQLIKAEWLIKIGDASVSIFGRYDIAVTDVTDFQFFIRERK